MHNAGHKVIALALNTLQSKYEFFVKKWANSGPFLVYFRSFLVTISIQIEKSMEGVLGIRTRGRRMVGADKTTELWWSPHEIFYVQSEKTTFGQLLCLSW